MFRSQYIRVICTTDVLSACMPTRRTGNILQLLLIAAGIRLCTGYNSCTRLLFRVRVQTNYTVTVVCRIESTYNICPLSVTKSSLRPVCSKTKLQHKTSAPSADVYAYGRLPAQLPSDLSADSELGLTMFRLSLLKPSDRLTCIIKYARQIIQVLCTSRQQVITLAQGTSKVPRCPSPGDVGLIPLCSAPACASSPPSSAAAESVY